jgi:predicted transcriptional regulator
MKRSKLKLYVDILKAMAQTGPLKPIDIATKVKVDGIMLKVCLDFLVEQDLVEERTQKKERQVFAVTQRGINVLTYFRELTQEISDLKES